jgi:hypothetical protein
LSALAINDAVAYHALATMKPHILTVDRIARLTLALRQERAGFVVASKQSPIEGATGRGSNRCAEDAPKQRGDAANLSFTSLSFAFSNRARVALLLPHGSTQVGRAFGR